MTSKKVVITGCAGLLGSYSVKRLSSSYSLIGIDNLTSHQSYTELSQDIVFYNLDLRDTTQLTEILKEGVDTVIHLAGNSDTKKGIESPILDFENNCHSTFSVLEAMRRSQTKNLILASTATIFSNDIELITEEMSPDFQSTPYSAAKLSSESFAQSYVAQYGINVCVLRLATLLAKEMSMGHIRDFVQKLKKDPSSLEIKGNGEQTKSFIHVQDAANAIAHFVDKGFQGHEIYNVSADNGLKIKDSIKYICEALSLSPQLKFQEDKNSYRGESTIRIQDNRKLKETGWKPQIPIKQAVMEVASYHANENTKP